MRRPAGSADAHPDDVPDAVAHGISGPDPIADPRADSVPDPRTDSVPDGAPGPDPDPDGAPGPDPDPDGAPGRDPYTAGVGRCVLVG